MKIAIRVDASGQIGTGHFMRCLTMADAWKKQGSQIRFVSRHLPEEMHNMLTTKEHEFALLENEQNGSTLDELTHAPWLGVSQAQDATDTIRALSDQTWDWLIVDHYALDSRWESGLRQIAKMILAIDDIADRQHDCDLLLDQNLYGDMGIRYTDKVPKHCGMLLGPNYALLRDEFRKLREHIKPRNGSVKRILIFFGGVDAGNFTGRAIEALAVSDLGGIHVDVVIGAQHPCGEIIKAACAQRGYACHIQTTRMAELMASADLAIGAGGSASWERCCLGVPAILVALADNQINIAKALDAFGACIYIGTANEASVPIIRDAIVGLLSNQVRTMELSKVAYSLVDGLGVNRVCQEMN
jgi:UDP-2,4-diacetamido-2,4,6-trideoxy-beta-L-altropyranose hydrolase